MLRIIYNTAVFGLYLFVAIVFAIAIVALGSFVLSPAHAGFAIEPKGQPDKIVTVVPGRPIRQVWPVCSTFEGALALLKVDQGMETEDDMTNENAADAYCTQNFQAGTSVTVTELFNEHFSLTSEGRTMFPVRATGLIDGHEVTGFIVVTFADLPRR
jgi:hypothetical protein